jgi:ABC-type branched-subunit amino acid transport system substrate-binding protein
MGLRFSSADAGLRVLVGISLTALVLLAGTIFVGVVGSQAQTGTLAEESFPYTIAVHVSSSADGGPEEVAAIQDFVARRAETINEAGGIQGHPVEIKVFDDKSKVEKTIENVEEALKDPRLIAMVGIWNSTRGSQVMDIVGASGIPLISELSVESLFADHRNIYTLTRAVSDEQEVFLSFAKDRFKSLAFVGLKGDLYTTAFHNHLETAEGQLPIEASLWIDGELDQQRAEVEAVIEQIRSKKIDTLFLSIGSRRGAEFLAALSRQNIDIPVFIALGSINGVVTQAGGGGRDYAGGLYEIAEGGIANLNNERLEQLMRNPERMASVGTYSPYAIGYGARYADLVAMLAETAAQSPSGHPGRVADYLVDELGKLREGRRVWRGWAQDWSFTDDRASAERSLLVWRPKLSEKSILAPSQYVRDGSTMRAVPVLYVHLDMVRISHVDSNDRSFEADFFFTMRSQAEIPISAIEFTNAKRGQISAKPLISIRRVHREDEVGPHQSGARIYKVSGRFGFNPDLRKYPFDEQIFSISFQPATTAAAFFLQPPSEDVRGQSFFVDGWKLQGHYVGTKELIIRSIADATGAERVIPYYNFNYTWVMQRQVTDYLLRVVVPLAFIMIVAYVAHFIPTARFEAIMGIQVTALLSAIALYLALQQPASDEATLSDEIFVMAYAAITAMITLSVLEVNTSLTQSTGALRLIHHIQIYAVPIIALGLIAYILISASNPVTLQKFYQTFEMPAEVSSFLSGAR